jgi:hypothetical protein
MYRITSRILHPRREAHMQNVKLNESYCYIHLRISMNMAKQKFIILACILITAAAAAGCAGRQLTNRKIIELHLQKIQENNKKACTEGCMAFEGDSNVELINFQEYFSEPACNIAYRGSRTNDLLKRKEKIYRLKPSTIVVLVGGNDVITRIPIDESSSNYEKLIGYYKTFCKNVYCISNLPVNQEIVGKNSEMERLNASLSQICRKLGATYVNVFQQLQKNGGLNPSYAMDPVHLNKEGHDVLVGILKKYMGK